MVKGQIVKNAPIELRFINNDPYDILLASETDFEIHLRSLRGHKGVKGQIYKDAPIALKCLYNDPYDILSILKIFCNSFEVTKGSQRCKRSCL